jgi:hypothetical protein
LAIYRNKKWFSHDLHGQECRELENNQGILWDKGVNYDLENCCYHFAHPILPYPLAFRFRFVHAGINCRQVFPMGQIIPGGAFPIRRNKGIGIGMNLA